MARLTGRTYYSEKIKVTPRNYGWAVSFDITDGYFGITQYDDDGKKIKDRILLSPAQFKELVDFAGIKRSARAA